MRIRSSRAAFILIDAGGDGGGGCDSNGVAAVLPECDAGGAAERELEMDDVAATLGDSAGGIGDLVVAGLREALVGISMVISGILMGGSFLRAVLLVTDSLCLFRRCPSSPRSSASNASKSSFETFSNRSSNSEAITVARDAERKLLLMTIVRMQAAAYVENLLLVRTPARVGADACQACVPAESGREASFFVFRVLT